MKQTKPNFSKIIILILFIVFFWIAVTYFAKTKEIVEVLVGGKWYWMILAVLSQIVFYPFYAYFIEYIFKIFKVNLSRKEILPVYIASKFTDVALPIATLGEVAIFVRSGKKKNLSPLNVSIGIIFAMLFEVTGFVAISLLSLAILSIFGQSREYLLITLLILAAVILLVVLFLIRITKSDKPLNKFFLWLIRVVEKLIGQESANAGDNNQIFKEAGNDLRAGKKKVWPAFGLSLLTHAINITTLAFVFLAFVGRFNPLAVVAGYIACLLFTIVSITPQGVGVAEAIMITTIHSFGLSVSEAAVITLAFRGLLYWLPLFPGFYVFSRTELKSDNN